MQIGNLALSILERIFRMGWFDDFVVGKIDDLEQAVNRVSDALMSSTDKVEQTSGRLDSAVKNAGSKLDNGIKKAENKIGQVDKSVRRAASWDIKPSTSKRTGKIDVPRRPAN